jgi:hypothetical protein
MPRSRQEILAREELLATPVVYQRQFWARYNRRGGLRRVSSLGEAVAGVVSEDAFRVARRLGGAEEAWLAVVPRGLAAKTHVESLRQGRLVVRVDSASTRYVLSRRLKPVLLEALNNHPRLARTPVRAIEYRIGRFDKGDADATR